MRFDLLLELSAEFHAADVRASFQATRLSALLTSQLPSVLDGSPMEAGSIGVSRIVLLSMYD